LKIENYEKQYAQRVSNHSEMRKEKRYASFAKTGWKRRFWQKRHTGDVSIFSEMRDAVGKC